MSKTQYKLIVMVNISVGLVAIIKDGTENDNLKKILNMTKVKDSFFFWIHIFETL